MRIGINALFYIPSEVGGSETYLTELLKRFSARDDMSLVVFTNNENHSHLSGLLGDRQNVLLTRIHLNARSRVARILHEQFTLPRKARQERVDLLWSPGYTSPFSVDCPQVVSVLDMQYKEFPADLSPLALLITSILVPMSIRRSAAVITLSEFARRQIVEYVPVPPARIHVSLLAADQTFADVDDGAGDHVAALVPESLPFILCVANTYPHKNVHSLVEAYGRLQDEVDARLVLIGRDGRGEKLVRDALLSHGLHDKVTRLSGLSRPQLIALYQAACLFVFPSLYEGFGLPVLEAMTAGTPVIAANTGPMPEIGGDCITYFDGTADDLVRALRTSLARNDSATTEIVSQARARAAQFTWQKTEETTVKCFKEVLSSTHIF